MIRNKSTPKAWIEIIIGTIIAIPFLEFAIDFAIKEIRPMVRDIRRKSLFSGLVTNK